MNKIVVIVIIIFIIVGIFWLKKRNKKYKGGGIVPHNSKYIGLNPEVIPQMYKDFFLEYPIPNNEYIKRVIFHENIPINDDKEHFENILFMINTIGDIMSCKFKKQPHSDINYRYYVDGKLKEKHLEISTYYNFLKNTLIPFIKGNQDKALCKICLKHYKIIIMINNLVGSINKKNLSDAIYTLIFICNTLDISHTINVFNLINKDKILGPYSLYFLSVINNINSETRKSYVFSINSEWASISFNIFNSIDAMKSFIYINHPKITYIDPKTLPDDQIEFIKKNNVYNINGEYYFPICYNISYKQNCTYNGEITDLYEYLQEEETNISYFLFRIINRVHRMHRNNKFIFQYEIQKIFFDDLCQDKCNFVVLHENYTVDIVKKLNKEGLDNSFFNKFVKDKIGEITEKTDDEYLIKRCKYVDCWFLLRFILLLRHIFNENVFHEFLDAYKEEDYLTENDIEYFIKAEKYNLDHIWYEIIYQASLCLTEGAIESDIHKEYMKNKSINKEYDKILNYCHYKVDYFFSCPFQPFNPSGENRFLNDMPNKMITEKDELFNGKYIIIDENEELFDDEIRAKKDIEHDVWILSNEETIGNDVTIIHKVNNVSYRFDLTLFNQISYEEEKVEIDEIETEIEKEKEEIKKEREKIKKEREKIEKEREKKEKEFRVRREEIEKEKEEIEKEKEEIEEEREESEEEKESEEIRQFKQRQRENMEKLKQRQQENMEELIQRQQTNMEKLILKQHQKRDEEEKEYQKQRDGKGKEYQKQRDEEEKEYQKELERLNEEREQEIKRLTLEFKQTKEKLLQDHEEEISKLKKK
jgi:hypothetical protein